MPSPYSGKVFSFDHNWTSPVVERLAWLTSVLRKRDGSEQRVATRRVPRRTIDYLAFVGGEDELDQRRRFDALVWTSQDEEVMVPFWPDATVLAANLASGSSLVTFPTVQSYDIDNGDGYLMFWKDYKTYEVVKVNPSGGSTWTNPASIALETNTINAWPKGTVVVPARRCLQVPSMSGNVFASDVQELKVSFRVIVPTVAATNAYRAIMPTTDTYRSTDVMADPGMDGTNTRTLERQLATVDFQVGPFSYDSIQTAPFGSLDMNVDLSGRDEVKHFLGWLNMRRGRQKAFWLPTWEKDFDLIERTADDQFTADSFGYTAAYNAIESRRDVAFINADGSMDYRRISGSSDDAITETFTVTATLPDPLTPERASFLRYCRLDQDEVELTWLTTDDVTTTLKVRELIKTA